MAVVGDKVTYVDEVSVPHDALVVARHDGKPRESTEDIDPKYSINLVYVSDDHKNKHDQYGTQIERASSVQGEASGVTAHGRFWRE